MAEKESGQKPLNKTWRKRKEERKVRFGEQLVPLHGANPDDWALIYDHSYEYIRAHWTGEKGAGSSGSADSADDDDSAAKHGNSLGHGSSTGNVNMFFKVSKDDCIYEAFVLLVLKNPSFETLGQARAWIAKTAANVYANEWSRAYRIERQVASSLRPDRQQFTSNLEAMMSAAQDAAEQMLKRKLSREEEKELIGLITGETEKDAETVKKFVARILSKQLRSKRGRQVARDS